MNVTPIVILPYAYSNGVAFEGKHAAEFLKLLSTATLVSQTSKHGHYDWYPADPDELASLNIQTRLIPLGTAQLSASLREELDRANKKLAKHADMIDAAEALAGDGEEAA
jgi:hypothetical protein